MAVRSWGVELILQAGMVALVPDAWAHAVPRHRDCHVRRILFENGGDTVIACMRGWAVGLMLVSGLFAYGCGGHRGGVIRESREYSFDDIAAAAAAETKESEKAPQ